MSIATDVLKSKLQTVPAPGEDQSVLIYFDNEDLGGSIPIQEKLRADEFCRGGRVVIRCGGPQAPKRELVL